MNIAYIYAKIVKKLRGKCLLGTTIGKGSSVYSGTDLIGCEVGRYTYVGYDCHMDQTTIGSFCSISDHVFVGGAEHPTNWASTSPMFQCVAGSGVSKRFAQFDAEVYQHTTIGNDVWIGHGVTIKTGVTIGNGAVIGSGSMVTKDVPPYAIVAGVPAKVLRYRFPEEIILQLQQTAWWNLTDAQLQQVAPYIQDPEKFIKAIQSLNI